METTLSKVIESEQILSEGHIELFMVQLVSACKYMHESKVVHRDLTPRNLLVNSNCVLKVLKW
jgi:serine/threonine protein kinase